MFSLLAIIEFATAHCSHEPWRSGVAAERRWLVVVTNCGALPRRRYEEIAVTHTECLFQLCRVSYNWAVAPKSYVWEAIPLGNCIAGGLRIPLYADAGGRRARRGG